MEHHHRLRLPPAFIRDCIECDCDVGEYEQGWLSATTDQLLELRDRAEYYAGPGAPDLQPRGLKGAAKALLKALARQGH